LMMLPPPTVTVVLVAALPGISTKLLLPTTEGADSARPSHQ
jgi:hypothetical protein